MACPPLCDNLDYRRDRFIRAENGRDAAILVGGALVAAAGGAAVLAGAEGAMLAAPVVARTASAGVVIGKSTQRLIQMVQEAGAGMDARITAVSRWLPSGQRALLTDLPGGARMLSGGAGERARQVILEPDGRTIVKALNVANKTWDVVKVIEPPR